MDALPGYAWTFRIILRLFEKSAFRLALAAAAAHDIAGFTDLTLTLDADDDGERTIDDDDLPLVFLATPDTDIGLLVELAEVFKAAVVIDGTDEVQCTGGFGKAVGAGAS